MDIPYKPGELKKTMTPNDPEFYKELLDHMSDGVYFVDRERRILYWNEGAHRLTGYTAEELLGSSARTTFSATLTIAAQIVQGWVSANGQHCRWGPHEANVFLRHKQGRRVPVRYACSRFGMPTAPLWGRLRFSVTTRRRTMCGAKRTAMNRLAFLDHLTQLPNRRYMEMLANTALSEFQVHQDPFGVIMFDLDGFKGINDVFGHACGDRALVEAARTLTGSLRPTDTVGRWAGDEFLAIVRNVDRDNLKTLAERCAVMVTETSCSSNDERRITLSISVGAALMQPGETAEGLIQRADKLMYQSKANGRGRATIE